MIKERLGCVPLVLQLPIGIESDLQGIVDLVKMKGITWRNEDLGAKFSEIRVGEVQKRSEDTREREENDGRVGGEEGVRVEGKTENVDCKQ